MKSRTEVQICFLLFLMFFAPLRAATRPAHSHISTGYEAGTVNMRSCPSVDCPVIAVLDEGTEIQLAQGTGGTWVNVLSPAGIGWVYSQYVEVTP